MLYDPSTAHHLKPWLVRTLEPICDAEPGALADYVLALLKHNVPETEMRKELTLQLEEFLEKEGPTFIDTLFTVLRTKSYLPYTDSLPTHPSYPSSSSQHPSDVGIPIPLDALLQNNATSPERGQKRALDYDDHYPAKGPRLGTDSHFSRYSNGRDYRPWSERDERQGIANSASQRIQTYQPPDRRGICRDYHKNGYCARGALCKYSHGDDAFVPSQLFPMNTSGPIPFMPMFPTGALPFPMTGPGAAYDPHEARLDMRPNGSMIAMNGRPQRPALIQRRRQEDPSNLRSSGELPVIQDLTPQDAAMATPSQAGQNGIQEDSSLQSQGGNMDVEDNAVAASTPDSRGMFAGGRGGHRGRGTFPGDVQSFRPERRNDKTLVVEKIPQDKLSLDAVNGWFKRFGTVTNVAIDVHSSKALVSFSEHREAFAAWKSEDAVFNNRFVKVFWHRPLEGHGQKGARMLAASGPLVASISQRSPAPPTSTAPVTPVQAEPTNPSPALPSAPTPTPRKPPVSTTASDLAAKQKLLEQQIAEQKSLMAALATASGEEKKSIMARLRKLGEEIQPSPAPTTKDTSSHSSSPAAPPIPEHEQKEKDRLDKELEFHHVTSSAESTEELQAKLAKLREEAASLGISEHSYGPGTPRVYRPYRGRGRGGRSFIRGGVRGGPPRGSMKLDNRPRQLLIKGVSEDAAPAIQSWYETTGQLESVRGEGGNVVAGFRTRAAAEQALAKGSDIPSVGTVQITWHTSQQSSAGSQAPTVPSSQSKTADDQRSSPPSRHIPLSPRHQEEEVVASGWGDGDEDGMGF
ncbi:hypothetical protein J3A83DRAFT_3542163 [Scleroderma citrinum]